MRFCLWIQTLDRRSRPPHARRRRKMHFRGSLGGTAMDGAHQRQGLRWPEGGANTPVNTTLTRTAHDASLHVFDLSGGICRIGAGDRTSTGNPVRRRLARAHTLMPSYRMDGTGRGAWRERCGSGMGVGAGDLLRPDQHDSRPGVSHAYRDGAPPLALTGKSCIARYSFSSK